MKFKKRSIILFVIILFIIFFAAFSEIVTKVFEVSPEITNQTLISLFFIVFAASFAVPTAAFFFIVSLTSLASSPTQVIIIFTVTLLATISGDSSAHFLAKSFQKEINDLVKKYTFLKNEEEKAAAKFKKHGAISIFFTRFIHGAAAILNYYSGIKNFKYKKFIIPVILGEIIYTLIYVLIGVFAKETWKIIITIIQEFSMLILLGLVIYYFYPKVRNRMKNGKTNSKN